MRSLAPFVIAIACGCDPVHGAAVSALPGEVAGVPQGPTHRPGQPCLLCHSDFSVAGTVFTDPTSVTAATNVSVNLTDSQSRTFVATTNEVGNFFVKNDDWQPVYPMKVSITANGVTTAMTANVGRDGACASCHADPVAPTSPGHVYTSADGGTP
ncbi:MAG TPA: hypothetical protein VH054_13000 [Polyangiaceae bacterium]|jgi:hypothetical protein|nr:hypothetical protein [Polyangiaceae bacterium]